MMAYNVYFACDSCGNEGYAWTNKCVAYSNAQRIARSLGWKIGKNGWICPKCQKKKKDGK